MEGTIVGTVAYMSPEQAQGKKVDARSDIFSFGAVLYEMITGRRAFAGETKLVDTDGHSTQRAGAAQPDLAGMPRELDRIVARCLRKDPERRFQNAADLKVALQEIKEESESGQPAAALRASPRRSRGSLVAGIACLCVTSRPPSAIWLVEQDTLRNRPASDFHALDLGFGTDNGSRHFARR